MIPKKPPPFGCLVRRPNPRRPALRPTNAPRLGTAETGGTLRFSIGAFNTTEDIDAAIAAMKEIASPT